jgi:SAM-dependent methyltransferase
MADKQGRTEIERWILSNLEPTASTTAELMYERMESQSGRCLPVIYEPIDHTERSHWHDEALVAAFAHAMGKASIVLDVGPGDGWPSLRMARRFSKIVGVDPSPRRVRTQRENAARLGITNVEYLEMDVMAMSFDDGSFGGVTAASAIEQSTDPERALREVFRVLAPGGHLAMVFEDYATCIPAEGDEILRAELSDEEAVVFYQCRRQDPPREIWYALFLDREGLNDDDGLLGRVEELSASAFEFDSVAGDTPARTGAQGVALLALLSPLVTETRFFELSHFTSASADALLSRVGFDDVRHLDHRLPELLDFFDVAMEAGKLKDGGPVFEAVAEVFGISAVERAKPGTGDFIIARRPA